jgi:putative flippase GtrA
LSKSQLLNKKDLIAYFLVAGSGALIQILVGSFLRKYVDYIISLSLAYVIAFVVGFVLTKMFAFDARNSNQTRREMVKFMMVATASLGITIFFAVVSFRFVNNHFGSHQYTLPFKKEPININELGCQVVGMGFSFVFNYILHKTFTFKSTGFYDRLKAIIR